MTNPITSTLSAETGAVVGRTLAAIPSPETNSVSFPVPILGSLTLHFYALCILAGVIAAVFWSERRWHAMGGEKGTIMDLAVPAVILGLIGGRLYHVISDYQLYFTEGRDPWQAFAIWNGGLGIWGAIPLGALGVWWAARKRGLSMSKLSFAIAPTIPLAQAFGRWGNYFNQELFGAPTNLPWAVEITPFDATGLPRAGFIDGETTYHPTFLYESLWCLALAILLVWAGRRFDMRGGRLFALYVMGYCVGRFWIEYLRVDPANDILGIRLNNYTAVLVFLGALAYFLWAGRRLDSFSSRVVPVGHDAGTQMIEDDSTGSSGGATAKGETAATSEAPGPGGATDPADDPADRSTEDGPAR